MRIAVAQINLTVGDVRGNADRIRECATRAQAAKASLLLTPELALCGYPPEDLTLRPGFLAECERELQRLAGELRGVVALVGYPAFVDGKRYNAVAVIRDRRIAATYYKMKLPNYTVFDEDRYFTIGREPCVIEVAGIRVGVLICEDIWFPEPAARARGAGAQVLVVLNASPYHTTQQPLRLEVVQARARETGLPVVYANLVGGQDELVFDGASFVVDGQAQVTQQLPAFYEALALIDFEGTQPKPVRGHLEPEQEAHVYSALTLGVRDYVNKNRFPAVLLGLSGGIDSALTLAIAVDALGRERVRALMLPSRYSAAISLEDARAMARILGVRYDEIAIEPVFRAFLAALAKEFEGCPADATEENIQARIRGTLLMALSNKYGAIVLTTGNKSEMAVGYATLYGDMAGGFAVLKDINKTLVYRLAHYRNTLGRVIPERIITRAPSAELRENQTDQDSLPPYDILDGILEAYVEQDKSVEEIIGLGYAPDAVRQVVRLIKRNEYKRRQAAVGIRITPRGFGKDWRYPITSRFRDADVHPQLTTPALPAA